MNSIENQIVSGHTMVYMLQIFFVINLCSVTTQQLLIQLCNIDISV